MLEKTRQVPKLADATYAHTLVIESTQEYKVHGPYDHGFDNQSMSIGSQVDQKCKISGHFIALP